MNKRVQEKFDSYPDHIRPKMEYLRNLILDVAAHTEEVEELEETLKWGEPSYLTANSKRGTTIRIDWKAKYPDQYAMYVNCKTSLVDQYRLLFPDLNYQGNRAIVFNVNENIPQEDLKICISIALGYHLEKNHNKAK